MLRQFGFVALCLLLLLGCRFRLGLCGLRQCADGVAGGVAANDDDLDTFVSLVNDAPQCRPAEGTEVKSRDAEREHDSHAQRLKRHSFSVKPEVGIGLGLRPSGNSSLESGHKLLRFRVHTDKHSVPQDIPWEQRGKVLERRRHKSPVFLHSEREFGGE